MSTKTFKRFHLPKSESFPLHFPLEPSISHSHPTWTWLPAVGGHYLSLPAHPTSSQTENNDVFRQKRRSSIYLLENSFFYLSVSCVCVCLCLRYNLFPTTILGCHIIIVLTLKREYEEGVLIQRCRRDNKRKKNELEVCGEGGWDWRLFPPHLSLREVTSFLFSSLLPLGGRWTNRIGVIVFTWKGKCISFVRAFNFVLQSRLLWKVGVEKNLVFLVLKKILFLPHNKGKGQNFFPHTFNEY